MSRWARVFGGVVVEVRERDSPPYGPGYEAVDHPTKGRWLPVAVEGAIYNPVVQVRSAPIMVVEAERVVERYAITARPLADLRAAMLREVRADARSRLSDTDWYAIRRVESGAAVPVEIADYRSAVRAVSNAVAAEIGGADLPTLATYQWAGRWPASPL